VKCSGDREVDQVDQRGVAVPLLDVLDGLQASAGTVAGGQQGFVQLADGAHRDKGLCAGHRRSSSVSVAVVGAAEVVAGRQGAVGSGRVVPVLAGRSASACRSRRRRCARRAVRLEGVIIV
jgi:hypothetical protein